LASNAVTVQQAGTYHITYSVLVGGTPNASYGLFVNGNFVAGSASGTSDTAAATQIVAGSAIVSLSANAVVSVRNRGNTADTLAVFVDGQLVNSVTLTIIRVD